MIDSTKSPVPAWKRYLTIALLAVLVVAAGYLIYTHELKSSSSSRTGSPAAASPVNHGATATAGAASVKSAPTTVPGGVPESNRNPFAG